MCVNSFHCFHFFAFCHFISPYDAGNLICQSGAGEVSGPAFGVHVPMHCCPCCLILLHLDRSSNDGLLCLLQVLCCLQCGDILPNMILMLRMGSIRLQLSSSFLVLQAAVCRHLALMLFLLQEVQDLTHLSMLSACLNVVS